MPITGGKYVNPGWVNGTSPNINAVEMNAISDSLEQVPVANGGTGATNAAGARTNLGVPNINDLKNKGNATTPVFFDSNGAAQPITVISGNLSATANDITKTYTAVAHLDGNYSKFGKVVMVNVRVAIDHPPTTRPSDEPVRNRYSFTGLIPSGFRPPSHVEVTAAERLTDDANAWYDTTAYLHIQANGDVKLVEGRRQTIVPHYYIRFTIVYITS